MVRWNEKVSLEFVTSVLGGVGCAYSLQSFVLIQGGQLGPSVIFLTASLLIIFGFRFQRHRRRLVDDPHYRNLHMAEKNYYDEKSLPPQQMPPPAHYLQPPPPQMSKKEYRDVKRQHESWEKLQKSIESMNDMLARKAEMERQEYERKKRDDELSLKDKIQLKNIIHDYNTRRRMHDEFHDDELHENGSNLEIC